jgi:hypothetical protein
LLPYNILKVLRSSWSGEMGKKWLLLALLGMSCPVFATSSTVIDTGTSVTKTTVKVIVVNNQGDNDSEAPSTTVATSSTTTTTARPRSNARNRWHSMMPGMFR